MDTCHVCSSEALGAHPCRTKVCQVVGCEFRLFDDDNHELNLFHQKMHGKVSYFQKKLMMMDDLLNAVYQSQPEENKRYEQLLEDCDTFESLCLDFEDEVLTLKNDHVFIESMVEILEEDAERLNSDLRLYY